MSAEYIHGSDATPNDPNDPKNHQKVESYRIARRAAIARNEQQVYRKSVLFGLTSGVVGFDAGQFADLARRAQSFPEIHAALLEDLTDPELESYAKHMLEGELKGSS